MNFEKISKQFTEFLIKKGSRKKSAPTNLQFPKNIEIFKAPHFQFLKYQNSNLKAVTITEDCQLKNFRLFSSLQNTLVETA